MCCISTNKWIRSKTKACLISRDLIQESGKHSTVSCTHRSAFSCKTSRARHLLFSSCLKFVFWNICMDCPGRVSLIQMSSDQSSPTIGQMAQCSCRGTMAQFVASTWWLTTAYNLKSQCPLASTCTRHTHGTHICKQALTHTHIKQKLINLQQECLTYTFQMLMPNDLQCSII